MITLTSQEKAIAESIQKIKDEAGTHSPSIYTLVDQFPEITINIDACFLSNPYASRLFLDSFHQDFSDSRELENLIQYYPSQNAVIAQLVAAHLDISPKNIFMGNGAIEVIQAVVHNFVERKLLINIPTFSSYYEFAKDHINVVYYQLRKEDNFELEISHYLETIKREQPDTVVLVNPNNPDGSYIHSSDLDYLLSQLQSIDNVIVDESFIHFADEGDRQINSAVKLLKKYDNLIVIKSMSKDFGIAGIRAGYGVMSDKKVEYLLKNGYLWNLSGFSEYFFRLFVQDEFQKKYQNARLKYIAETQAFIHTCSHIHGIKAYPSQGNFVLLELLNGLTSFDFFNKLLLGKGIYTRNCKDKIGLDGNFIRVASRTEAENKIIIQSICKILQSNKNKSLYSSSHFSPNKNPNATIRV